MKNLQRKLQKCNGRELDDRQKEDSLSDVLLHQEIWIKPSSYFEISFDLLDFFFFFYHDTALKLDHMDLDGVDGILRVLMITIIKHWHKYLLKVSTLTLWPSKFYFLSFPYYMSRLRTLLFYPIVLCQSLSPRISFSYVESFVHRKDYL